MFGEGKREVRCSLCWEGSGGLCSVSYDMVTHSVPGAWYCGRGNRETSVMPENEGNNQTCSFLASAVGTRKRPLHGVTHGGVHDVCVDY